MKPTKPIKVCFVSFNSFPLFQKYSRGYFGGAEVQISLIVKALAKDNDFQVSLIVGDYGQKSKIAKKSLTIYKCLPSSKHYSLVILNLLHILMKIKADVYVERTMNVKVGLVALFCKLFRKKFIYMMAHDWDSTKNAGNYLKGLYRWLFIWGVKNADLIVTQNKKQQKELMKNYGFKGDLMRSVMPVNHSGKPLEKSFGLWVGRADRWKQPEKIIQLARKLKKEKIVMICRQGSDQNYFNWIKKLAQVESNIEFLPVVPFELIGKYYQQAKMLINTSKAEGFPNTFLQAGITKTPIVSLRVNPDGYIDRYNCGFEVKNNLIKLVYQTKKLFKDSTLNKEMGLNHFDYIKRYHSLKNITKFKQKVIRLCKTE